MKHCSVHTRFKVSQIEETRREAGPGEELVLDLEDETPVTEEESPGEQNAVEENSGYER